MTRAGWEPTTEAEVALYEALLAGDQERYFRVLGRVQLLLPVSADAVAGRSPMGWATWTSNDHTHLLAFTSPASMRTCLAEHAGAARRMPFAELAAAWPNHDWWLAVNPGLPIEGYLPAWFVTQLSQGDARLPNQTSSAPRDRLARVEALERAKAARAAGHQPPRDGREPVRVSATVGPRALPSAAPQPPSEPYPPLSPSQSPFHDPRLGPRREYTDLRREPAPAAWGQPEPYPPTQPLRREPASAAWGQPEPYSGAQQVPAPAAWSQSEPYPGAQQVPAPAAWTQPDQYPGAQQVPAPAAWSQSEPYSGAQQVPAPAAWTRPEPYSRAQQVPAPAAWTQPDQYQAAQPAPAARTQPEPYPGARSSRREPAPAPAAWTQPEQYPPVPAPAPTSQPEPRPSSKRVRRQPVPAAWQEPTAPVNEPAPAPGEGDPIAALAAWREAAAAAGESNITSWGEPTLVTSSTELPRRQPGSAPSADQRQEPATQAQPRRVPVAETQPADQRHSAPAEAFAGQSGGEASSFWRDSTPPSNAEATRQSATAFWRDGAARRGAAEAAQSGAAARSDSASRAAGAEATVQSGTAFWDDSAAKASAEATVQSGAAFWRDSASKASGNEATVQSGTPFWGDSAAKTGGAEPTVQSGTPFWGDSAAKTGGAEPTVQSGTPFWGDSAAKAGSAEASGQGGVAETAAEAGLLEPAPTTVLGTRSEPAPEQHGLNGKAKHAGPESDFVPANSVEEQLFEAAEAGNTDLFLSTLLLATVLIPKSAGTTNGAWRPQPIDGEPHIVCYTSTQHLAEPLETVSIKFIKLIQEWPDPTWSFAVNPGTPVGATLPGGQLLALANWAADVGLGGDEDEQEQSPSESKTSTPVAGRANPELTVLQKAIAPSQVSYYLERGYDRVSGFVHRAHEVGHLKGIAQMRGALGLDWTGSPFAADANEIYVLRWSAYRPNLYRIPYGGNHEAGMKAMQGWVIERAPFRGNGFAPGESKEIIAEFKVDSARLPHGARLLRLRDDGVEEIVAVLDADGQRWLRTDGG